MNEDPNRWHNLSGSLFFKLYIFTFSPSSANQLQFPHSLHFQEITFCGIYEIISDSEDTTCGSTSSSLTSHAFRMISSKCL